MNQTCYTITLDTYNGLCLAQACKSAASWMAQDLAEDENTSRSFKARLFGHTPRKDLSRFPQMIAEV